jgi:ribosomal protein L37AE/L43A
MSGTFMALVAVGPAIAAMVVAVALLSQRKTVCPSCSHRSLRRVQLIRATVVVNERNVPDSWTYFECDSCAARFKQHADREYTVPSEAEWIRYCSKR